MSNWDPITTLVEDVYSGKTTAVSLYEKAAQLIEQSKEYNAVVILDESARGVAEAIDARIAKGEKPGRLAGIPYIAKDNFLTEGVETTAASNILKGFVPPFSATAIKKLEAEGAVLVGKANMDAFASGSSTEKSAFGPTKNPHDTERVPGGTSGGSAAAVVLGLTPFALGTDTGGSIRQPASYTGSVGLKPTYGLVSRYGVIAMASSTDVIGPLATRVDDAALILDIISGRDNHDATSIERDEAAYTDYNTKLSGSKFGLIKEYMDTGVDDSVRQAILNTAEKIKAQGGEVVEISIPELKYSLPTYYIIVPAELSSNLNRYDGIRYGKSAPEATKLDEVYSLTRSQGFNDELRRRILIGTYVLSSGYYDAYYKKAQTVRTLLVNKFVEAFEQVDFLIGPVAPTPAFKIGENDADPLSMYLIDIMTVTANLVGIPGISVPVAKKDGLPIGFQIMAPQRHDRALLSVAKEVENIVGYES